MSDLIYYVNSLIEFHETFQAPVVRNFTDVRVDAFPLRKTLIAEEYAEYARAKNRVDVIDALGDLLYVFIGTVTTTGVKPFEYVLGSNVKKTGAKFNLLPAVNGMLVVLSKGKEACYRGLLSAETTLYWRILDASVVYGFNLKEAFKLIHASNMTKLWPPLIKESSEFNPETMTATFCEPFKMFVVKRKSDGKILKPSTYQAVDLTSL